MRHPRRAGVAPARPMSTETVDLREEGEGEGKRLRDHHERIAGELARALEETDGLWWGMVAEGLRRRAEHDRDGHATQITPSMGLMAGLVPYPGLAHFEKVAREATADGWRDCGELIRSGLKELQADSAGGTASPAGSGMARRTASRAGSATRAGRGTSLAAGEAEGETGAVPEGERLVIPRDSIDRYVRTRIPPLRETLEETRRRQCAQIIGRIADRGGDVRDAIRALEEEGFGASRAHRELIARTEATELYTHGTVARGLASEACIGFRFNAITDDRVCEICEGLDGQEFRDNDLDGVAPPLHGSCRCELEPILIDETPDFTRVEDYIADPDMANPPEGWGDIDLGEFPERRTASRAGSATSA